MSQLAGQNFSEVAGAAPAPLLDARDPTPLYAQLARVLRRRIFTGEFLNGEAIPSEPELQRLFGTTRGTVRKGVSVLVNEGLLEQVRGKGTFVRLNPVNYSIWNFGSFTDYARSRLQAPVSLVVDKHVEEHGGERLLRLVRARGIATEAETRYVHLDSSLLSLTRFPGLEEFDFASESLYRVLRERYNVYPQRTELTISTVYPEPAARRLLDIDDSVHCVTKVDGTVYDTADRLVEHTTVIYSPQQTLRLVTVIDPFAHDSRGDTGNPSNAQGSVPSDRHRGDLQHS